MAQLRIDLLWHCNTETFPWSSVEPKGDRIQLLLGVARQVGPLGQVLAQQATGIIVGPTLPGAVRIGKEHLDRETVRSPLMFRHLFPPIIGQRVPQRGRHMAERVFRTLQDRLPKELALEGITEMAAANALIRGQFVPAYKQRFAVHATELGTAFMP